MINPNRPITLDDPFWLDYLHRQNAGFERLIQPDGDGQKEISVAIYLRVSTDEQAREGYSLPEQQRLCEEFAARHGWPVYQVYIDDGYSGTNDKRPAFQRLQREAQAGHFQGILAHKVDRVFRNAHGMLSTFRKWRQQEIFFASVQEQIDFTTPWGKLILGVLSLMAEIFIDNLREETKKS